MTFNIDGEAKSIVQSEVLKCGHNLFLYYKRKHFIIFPAPNAFSPSSKLLCDNPWSIWSKITFLSMLSIAVGTFWRYRHMMRLKHNMDLDEYWSPTPISVGQVRCQVWLCFLSLNSTWRHTFSFCFSTVLWYDKSHRVAWFSICLFA